MHTSALEIGDRINETQFFILVDDCVHDLHERLLEDSRGKDPIEVIKFPLRFVKARGVWHLQLLNHDLDCTIFVHSETFCNKQICNLIVINWVVFSAAYLEKPSLNYVELFR